MNPGSDPGGHGPRTGAGPAWSLGLVATAFVSSLLAIEALAGLLVIGEAPRQVRTAALLLTTVSLAMAQPPLAAGLARRVRATLHEGRLVTVGTTVASLALLVLGALLAGAP